MKMPIRSTGGWLRPLLALAVWGACGALDPAGAESSPPVSWSTQLRSTGYFLQQAEPGSTDVEDRLPFYEQLDAGAANLLDGKLDFRFSGRYGDDLRYDGGVPQEGKWFVGYGRLRLAPMNMQLRAGRQFIQEGTIYSTLDGGWLALRPHRQWRVNAWAGVAAPGDRAFEFGDDFLYGGRVTWAAHRQLNLGAWAGQRTRDGEALTTEVGGEVVARPIRTMKALARGTWDFEADELEKLDLLVDWKHRPDWPMFRGQYELRSQNYDPGSWWETFAADLYDVQLLRGSVRWTDKRGIGGEVQGFGSFVDERRNGEVGGAFLAPHVRVGLGYLNGDDGEQIRFYGDVDWSYEDRLDLSAGANFIEYALVADATSDETRDLTTYYARGELLIVPGVELMSELQYLENPVYESDVRVLVGLDLMASRGPSRLGIGSGGMR